MKARWLTLANGAARRVALIVTPATLSVLEDDEAQSCP
jgi:hypothetical protein